MIVYSHKIKHNNYLKQTEVSKTEKTIESIKELTQELQVLTATPERTMMLSERIVFVAEQLKAIADSDEYECDTDEASLVYYLITITYIDAKKYKNNIVDKARHFKWLADELTKAVVA